MYLTDIVDAATVYVYFSLLSFHMLSPKPSQCCSFSYRTHDKLFVSLNQAWKRIQLKEVTMCECVNMQMI